MAGSGRVVLRDWALLAAMFVGLTCALFANEHRSFDPVWLIVPLNAVFLTVVPLMVAWFTVSAYRSTGVTAVLALGSAMLAVGVGAGAVPGVLRYGTGPNATVTMHNSAVLLAGLAEVTAAILSIFMLVPRDARHRTRDLAVVYFAVVAVLTVVLILLHVGWLPTFFTADGPTLPRQVVLGAAVELFAVASVVWALTYARTRMPFARWCVLGLTLFTLGLTAVFFQHTVGNVVGWVGRAGQYAGSLYLLLAVLRARTAPSGELRSRMMAMSLAQPAVRLEPLVESTTDAIAMVDRDHVMYWNDAARRLFGYAPAEAFGERLPDLVAPEGDLPVSRNGVERTLAESCADGHWEGELETRSGNRFPAELVVYDYQGSGRRVCVIRDVSERVQVQGALRAAHRELERRAAQLEQAERVAELGSWQWDVRTGEIAGSAEVYVILGIRPGGRDELAEARAAMHVSDDEARALVQRVLSEGTPFEISQQIFRPDGDVRDVLMRGELMVDEAGSTVGVRGTLQDVTALRRAEKEARQGRRRMAEEATRERQRAERERYAREVNDTIVQGLVAAEIALDLNDIDFARRLIGDTSLRARRWIGELLAAEGPLRPGAARRSAPAESETKTGP